MDNAKGKWTKNLIIKAWKRCSTLPKQTSSGVCRSPDSLPRSKTWSYSTSTSPGNAKPKKEKAKVAPIGCFTICVGPERQRFVVKAKFANHPLFKMLLEDAALEYGYKSDGPISLPCDVDLFYQVLAEMESKDIDEDMSTVQSNCSPLVLFSPSLRRNCSGNRGYRLLTPASSSSSSIFIGR